MLIQILITLVISAIQLNQGDTHICDESNQCNDININCSANEKCIVKCISDNACADKIINCPSNEECEVHCINPSATDQCEGITINGQLSSYLLINATLGNSSSVLTSQNQPNTSPKTIQSSIIYCPSNGPFTNAQEIACDIICDGDDLFRRSKIYAIEGFNDLTVTSTHYQTNFCFRNVGIYCTPSFNSTCTSVTDGSTATPHQCQSTNTCNNYIVTNNPTQNPTVSSGNFPTISPTKNPTTTPSISPTHNPTLQPSISPTTSSVNPSISPSGFTPTITPSNNPTKYSSDSPSYNPTISPSYSPSYNPTISPIDGGIVDDGTTNSPEMDSTSGNGKTNADNRGLLDSTSLTIISAVSVVSICLVCGIIILCKHRKKKQNRHKISNESADYRARQLDKQIELTVTNIEYNDNNYHENNENKMNEIVSSPPRGEGVSKYLSGAQQQIMQQTPGGPDTADINEWLNKEVSNEPQGLSNSQIQKLHVTKMGLEEYEYDIHQNNNMDNTEVQYLSEAQKKELKKTPKYSVDDELYYFSDAQKKELKITAKDDNDINDKPDNYLSAAQQKELQITAKDDDDMNNNPNGYLSEAQKKELTVTADASDDYLSQAQRTELRHNPQINIETATGTDDGWNKQ